MTDGECLLVHCERVTGFPWLGVAVLAVGIPIMWLVWRLDRKVKR